MVTCKEDYYGWRYERTNFGNSAGISERAAERRKHSAADRNCKKEEKKMKKRIWMLIIALLLLCFSACTEEDAPTGHDDSLQSDEQLQEPAVDEADEQEGEKWSESEYDWRLSVPFYGSADEAANMEYVNSNPIFILHDGRFYNLAPTKMGYTDSDRVSESAVIDALPMSEDELPVLNLAAGDRLVTFSANDNDYAFVPLTSFGACLPVIWRAGVVREQLSDIYGSNLEFDIMPAGVGQDMSYVPDKIIEEINGQQFTPYTGTESGQAFADYAEKVRQADTEFCAVLDSLSIPYFAADWSWNNGGGIVQDYTNYVILGNYGDSVTLGQYQGTKYVEANFTLVNTLYELYPDNMLDTAAERTHDGYSAIQIPEDISGTYAIRDRTENGTARCFALLIVR